MRDTAGLLIGFILLALRPDASAQQTVTTTVSPPEVSKSRSLPGLQAQPRESARPASLRLNLAPKPLYSARPDSTERVSRAGPSLQQSFSELKLFEGGGVAASVGKDGRIHYRLPAPSILGSQLTGQISTNSAKLTLIWRSKN